MTVATLPDGQPSLMNQPSFQERSQFVISAVPSSGPLTYKPLKSCRYTSSSAQGNVLPHQGHGELTVRRVRDRLQLVDEDSDGKKSSFLLSANGKIYDFNIADDKGSRSTTDNSSAAEFSYMLPEYVPATLKPGDTAATLTTKNGSIAGAYQYRGVVQRNGSPAYLLDMMINVQNNPTYSAVVAGFDVVDARSNLPSLLVMDVGNTKLRFEATCSF